MQYAWIQYGDELPKELNNDSKQDANWKVLKSGYDNLNKYVHVSGFNIKEKLIVESSLKSIETALILFEHWKRKSWD